MKAIWFVFACVLSCHAVVVCAQTGPRIPDPAAYALSMAPDARASGMGFAGTATSGDANAMFWNPGKLPDAPGALGVSATYSPWLPYLMDDAWVGYASMYRKLAKGQVVGASVDYFNQPRLSSANTLSPGRDFAVSAAYAKLLVPTPAPGRNVNQRPYLEGILASFSDAPGGFKEEMQEVVVSVGAEYWYQEKFALRSGYRAENAEKGGRKFLTVGAGARFLDHFGIDFAYLFPTGVNDAMKNMYKVGGLLYF